MNASQGRAAVVANDNTMSRGDRRAFANPRINKATAATEAIATVKEPLKLRTPYQISAADRTGLPRALFSGVKNPLVTNHSPMTTRLKTRKAAIAPMGNRAIAPTRRAA